MLKITKAGQTFKVKVTHKETGSNYSIFAAIYNPKDKNPIAGTSFKDTSTIGDIKVWAMNFINLTTLTT
jgi:hypothetical protein